MKYIVTGIAICGLICFASSCKKDKENKTTSTSVSGFLISQHVIIDSSVIFIGPADEQDADATFLSDPAIPFSFTLVDSVFVNGSPLEVDGDSVGFIGPENEVDMNGTCNWRVKGNSFIPDFSFNFPVNYPGMAGTHLDTVDRTNGTTFHYSFTDADSVVIQIASTQTGQTVDKTFPGNSTSQQFTAAELQAVVPSSQVGFPNIYTVHAMRSTEQDFGGKTFRFSKVLSQTHSAWMK